MPNQSSRLQVYSSTEIDKFVFDYLKEQEGGSTKACRAITTYYLSEMVAEHDPRLEDPKLRYNLCATLHDLEARANLIRSTFPSLAPSTPPTYPVWLPQNDAPDDASEALKSDESEPDGQGIEVQSSDTDSELSLIQDADFDDEEASSSGSNGTVNVFKLPLSSFTFSDRESGDDYA